MTGYDVHRIREFITDRVSLVEFCFDLEHRLGRQYALNRLRGQISAEKAIHLIQIATRNEQLGDLVFWLIKFWTYRENATVVLKCRLDEDLGIFYEELNERIKQEKRKSYLESLRRTVNLVQALLQELGVSVGTHQAPGENERTQEGAGKEALPLAIGFALPNQTTQVTWDSKMGFHTSAFFSPYDAAALPLVLRALDAVQWPEYPQSGPKFSVADSELLSALELWEGERVVHDVHERVGRVIYESLVSDPNARSALSAVRNHATTSKLPLSLVLRFPRDAADLAAYPWELLRDDQGPLLASGSQRISFVRHLLLPWALPEPSPPGSELRILALAPLAGVSRKLREAERQARRTAWQERITAGNVTMEELSPATPEALTQRIRTGPPVDIVHFYGHGRYRDGKGSLRFDDGKGDEVWLEADQLAVSLCDTRLIMLHACHSSRISDQGLLTGVAPALSAAGVPAVVAMQMAVRVDAATRFAGVVYQILARGGSIQDAVSEARWDLYVCEGDRASWYVPTLTICSRDTGPLRLIAATD